MTNALKDLGIETKSVDLGEIVLSDNTDAELIAAFGNAITQFGFEVIEDKTARIISRIKGAVVDFVHHPSADRKAIKFSSYLAEFVGKDYNYLSGIFSAVEGFTIEQYLINQKIEKVKELLVYDELTLSEIANQLNYSSVQHLSTQFKKVTGLTPSHFKKIGAMKRLALDNV
jgi:AraC-like DNA-binding protein